MRKTLGRWGLVCLVGLPLLAMPVAAAAPLITSSQLADGSVTRNKIAYGAIDGDRIADRSITLNKLSVLTVLSANLGAESVTTPKLADKAVTTRKINTGAVRLTKLASKSVNSLKIVDLSILADDIASNAINTYKVLDNSLVGADIRNGTLTNDDLAAGTVRGDRIADGSLDGLDIQNNSLTGADIADGAVDQDEFPNALVADQTGLRIESGETTVPTDSLGTQLKTVSFTRNFATPPLVLVSFADFSDYAGTIAGNLVAKSTIAGADIKIKISSAPPGSYATVSWIAIGK